MADVEKPTRNYIVLCVKPFIKLMKDEFNAKFLDMDEYLNGHRIGIKIISYHNIFDLATAIDKLISSTVLTGNEVRAEIDYERSDDPNMDKHLMTKNYQQLGSDSTEGVKKRMTKHKINVKGAIIESDLQWIYDLFDIEATSPKKVADEIETAAGKDIEVIINSGGGSVYAASEIYTDLRSYQGIVETKIVGVAASAASVIAMAGKLSMSPTAQMMIHNASTYAGGDYRDMDDASDFLKNVNKTIANAYQAKSGLSESELLKLMDETTWFTAQQAKREKFD